MPFRYLAADQNVLFGAAVTNTAGTVDTTSAAARLCDGRGRPCTWQNGTAGASGVGSARRVDVVVFHSHNFDAALSVTISGGVSASGAAPPARRNGIPTDFGVVIPAPASTGTVQFGVAGNSVPVTIGEMLAGPLTELARGLPLGATSWGYVDGGSIRRKARFGTVPDLDLEQVQRWIKTSIYVTAAEADDLMQWHEATRNDTRPSVIVPFGDFTDVWVVHFSAKPTFSGWATYRVAELQFEEWPRTRW